MTTLTLAYLALGSNLNDPVNQLVLARAAINSLPGVEIIAASSLYQSPAWGSDGPQPDYINAVVAIRTMLSARDLWQNTSRVEQAQGRFRSAPRNSARTLDIDLLLYGNAAVTTNDLTLPHLRMHERGFVLLPLVEIAPDVAIPGQGKALDCLHRIETGNIHRLSHNSAWN